MVFTLVTTAGGGGGATVCSAVTCPAGYSKLDDLRISPNCYLFSGKNDARSWHSADAVCTSTKGAHLLVPDSLAEIEALRKKFGIGDNDGDVWTGANDLKSSGNFIFKVNNKKFDFNALPFGIENEVGMRGSCVEIELNDDGVWGWDADDCDERENYICELPVVSKNVAVKI
ncbi:snaclec 6-like [Mytilus trossulus]|uniref:snaclec 6-like n=1 Tax=Mytilus trossulus TaxID=6551 RepID=UPI003006F2BC